MSEVAEFNFVSEMPRVETRRSLLQQIKDFWKETDGGAIPIPLAAKMLNKDPKTITRWVDKGKVRAFKAGKQILVQIDDLEKMLDEPRDVGGRPKKAS